MSAWAVFFMNDPDLDLEEASQEEWGGGSRKRWCPQRQSCVCVQAGPTRESQVLRVHLLTDRLNDQPNER